MKLIAVLMALAGCVSPPKQSMDGWARDRVVMLYSVVGSCTGVEVKAPSKKIYILTARHCQILANDAGDMMAQDEAGHVVPVRVVAKSDGPVDLMLISGIGDKFVPLAKDERVHQHIFTITHGGANPSYRTDGELLNGGRYSVEGNDINLILSTAWVIPGSSGGPAMDMRGELVGIVSVGGNGPISGLVPLSDIKALLADK